MTAEDLTPDDACARLDQLVADLTVRKPLLTGEFDEQARAAALGTAVLAIQYARETVTRVIGDFEPDATREISAALDQLVEESPQPWGDNALHDLGNITARSARLLADIWLLGRLTVAVDPQSWTTDVLVQQCLQVVAETHLAGKLRAELDGMFGETDEPR